MTNSINNNNLPALTIGSGTIQSFSWKQLCNSMEREGNSESGCADLRQNIRVTTPLDSSS